MKPVKAYFEELADYNSWANELIINWASEISDDQWQAPLISSFSSIRDTFIHVVGAEHVWWQRLNKEESTTWIPAIFNGTKEEALALLSTSSAHLASFVKATPESQLSEEIYLRRLNGEENHMKVSEIFAHVFNHSTYHRGQLVTMFRQVGFTGVGSTDLLNFYRMKQ